jgi:hypothetical protein
MMKGERQARNDRKIQRERIQRARHSVAVCSQEGCAGDEAIRSAGSAVAAASLGVPFTTANAASGVRYGYDVARISAEIGPRQLCRFGIVHIAGAVAEVGFFGREANLRDTARAARESLVRHDAVFRNIAAQLPKDQNLLTISWTDACELLSDAATWRALCTLVPEMSVGTVFGEESIIDRLCFCKAYNRPMILVESKLPQ